MCKIQGLIYAIMAILIWPGRAQSDDLYLLRIDNESDLRIVNQYVEHALGMIDNQFIVELNGQQHDYLLSYNIKLEKIVRDFVIDQVYIIAPEIPGKEVAPAGIQLLYKSTSQYLAYLDIMRVNELRRMGYTVISLKDKKTPLFCKRQLISSLPEMPDFPTDSLADLVNADSLYSYVTRLEDFHTRYIDTDSNTVAQYWLMNMFYSFGYSNVQLVEGYFNGYETKFNVMCTKPGTSEPDKTIVIGAHFDSINFDTDPMIYAPGADDNASGVAIVLELARILKDYDSKKTIIFVAFNAEEMGLVGSDAFAWRLNNWGIKVEAMLNYDMVGYSAGFNSNVNLFYGPFDGYAQIMADAAERVSYLNPIFAGFTSGSDHYPFLYYGIDVCYMQEGEFNYDGWHTNFDLSSRMDFSYLEQIARTAAAGVGIISKAPKYVEITEILDVGNGTELLVSWESDCDPTYEYKLMYGTQSNTYTDTILIAPGQCFQIVQGLTPEVRYYFAISATNSDGFTSMFLVEGSGIPYIYPLAPKALVIEPDFRQLSLQWDKNKELDFSHYRIYRRDPVNDWQLITSTTDSFYVDNAIDGHKTYEYSIKAVDQDLNESELSNSVSATAATFDSGILFVEETSSGGSLNPSNSEQEAFYDSIFGGPVFIKKQIDSYYDALSRSLAGQFGSIFWFDDDLNVQLFSISEDSAAWYMNYPTNFVLAGWRTFVNLSDGGIETSGDFLYDNFRIREVVEQTSQDFIGVTAHNGWPNLELKSEGIFGGTLPAISIIDYLSGPQTIYTFNSASGNPAFDGHVAGLIYTKGESKRVALSFPIYQLTTESATNLIAYLLSYFEQEVVNYGDADNNGTVNQLDVLFLIAYLYGEGELPPVENLADANGDCRINLIDILSLINYLYFTGPVPTMGCVNK